MLDRQAVFLVLLDVNAVNQGYFNSKIVTLAITALQSALSTLSLVYLGLTPLELT